MELFPATAVEINGRALLFEGPPGSGKSDLALRCIDRGANLIGDDYVNLEVKERTLFASPPENIAGKLEVRGLGIFDFPPAKNVPVLALISLVPRESVPRMSEEEKRRILGLWVPAFCLHAFESSTPSKIFLLSKKGPELNF